MTTAHLTFEQTEELGRELDAIRAELVAKLGQEDRDYIYNVIKAQRALEVVGRGAMFLGFLPPFWFAGVAALSMSKILDNLEIGHNVMHGQYDWMRDPAVNSKMFEWDNVCPSEQWRHSHNYMHHTYTNILGKDRDIGYGQLRMDEGQKWQPYYLGNPIYAFLLMMAFEWGVMAHDLELNKIFDGRKPWNGPETRAQRKQIWEKGVKQVMKDYVLFPALTGPQFMHTLAGNAVANVVRNIWAFGVIFCGHFPTGVQVFSRAETENETRGEWYIRQMTGSANISGGPILHMLSGNLSYQIEHHLYPDIPARRYAEVAPQIREICERYGLAYTTGPLPRQLAQVAVKICKLALPPRKKSRSARSSEIQRPELSAVAAA
ncbi:fatty acid desaturase [Jatrophihabitans sp. GAS493]|uniref:fatty acid desaturase family protein n=1 Tax=Jatrophihabitans sp. GAS493 TaxID=1907575 RepID=UPI000BB76990|nr:acyl-CoA desaturase [Jatrophihabitans sp. GAS493]SOD71142.1 fatty acid desaturase [Jatrophihabitans sp. GAS493]